MPLHIGPVHVVEIEKVYNNCFNLCFSPCNAEVSCNGTLCVVLNLSSNLEITDLLIWK